MILVRSAAAAGFLAAALVFAGGCGSTTDRVTLTTSPRLNTCEGGGEPHPVVVRLYYLRASDRFARADFVALWQDDVGTLQDDRIRTVQTTLNPRQQITVDLERDDAAKTATAIGVVANFCRPGEGCWRRTVPIGKDAAKVRIHLDEGCLAID